MFLARVTGSVVATLAFGWVLMDALLAYFFRNYSGAGLQVNAILPAFILLLLLANGWRAVVPPATIFLPLVLASMSFAIAPLLVPNIPAYRVIELTGALCAFAIGYSYMRWTDDANSFAKLTIIVCGAYVVVCIIALLQLAPNIFPIVKQAWLYNGDIVDRPYVGINSNFQVFYLFPVVLALLLPYRTLRFWTVLGLTLGGCFVLARLQTRSGILVLVGTMLLCFLAPAWHTRGGRLKAIGVACLLIVIAAVGLAWVLRRNDLLVARFTNTDYRTGYGRLIGFTYLFEHLFDPSWWSPRGNVEFAARYGGTGGASVVPHSNITAMFLEGGILGLYMWIVVFAIPLIKLSASFFKKQLDLLATMALIGGVCMMVIELTLNVPFYKQPWLWAGAVVGALYRSRTVKLDKRRATIARGMPSSPGSLLNHKT